MLYSILDVKSHAFGPLVESRSDDEAIRSFLITIQNAPKSDLIGLFPQDFVLFMVGDFDHTSGLLSFESSPVQLMTGIEALNLIRSIDTPVSTKDVVDSCSNTADVVTSLATEE